MKSALFREALYGHKFTYGMNGSLNLTNDYVMFEGKRQFLHDAIFSDVIEKFNKNFDNAIFLYTFAA